MKAVATEGLEERHFKIISTILGMDEQAFKITDTTTFQTLIKNFPRLTDHFKEIDDVA